MLMSKPWSAVPASGVCQAGCAFNQLAQPFSAQLAQAFSAQLAQAFSAQLAQAFTGVAPRMCR
jgi:hypothetical protein